MHELVKRCSHFSVLRNTRVWGGATLVAVKNLPANVRT